MRFRRSGSCWLPITYHPSLITLFQDEQQAHRLRHLRLARRSPSLHCDSARIESARPPAAHRELRRVPRGSRGGGRRVRADAAGHGRLRRQDGDHAEAGRSVARTRAHGAHDVHAEAARKLPGPRARLPQRGPPRHPSACLCRPVAGAEGGPQLGLDGALADDAVLGDRSAALSRCALAAPGAPARRRAVPVAVPHTARHGAPLGAAAA